MQYQVVSCKLPAVGGGGLDKSNGRSGLGTPPRKCWLELAKFVLGNVIHSLLTERVACQCSLGCMGGSWETSKLVDWLPAGFALFSTACETPVYFLFWVPCVNLNGQIWFLMWNMHASLMTNNQSSNSTATDPFADWIYYCKILFLCAILLSACYLPSFVVAVVAVFIQFLPDIWENWTLWV